MLTPSARMGISTQRKITKLMPARTSTRTTVRLGSEPKTMRRVRFTRASALPGNSQSSRPGTGRIRNRERRRQARVALSRALRIRCDDIDAAGDRDVDGRPVTRAIGVDREPVRLADFRQRQGVE